MRAELTSPPMTRRLVSILVVLIAVTLLFARSASAHNSLVSSDPAEGSTLASAPSQVTLVFDKSVPLNTLSIEIIDATGVRSDLSGSAHGPSGDKEVVTPLPTLPPGGVTLRWRLVGADGHPITGRVAFSIAAPPATAPPATASPTPVDSSAPESSSPSTVPASTTPVPTPPVASNNPAGGGFSDSWTTPDWFRWLVRFGSYLAILAIGGVTAVTRFVWAPAWRFEAIQRVVRTALAATLAATVLQVLIIASDVQGAPPWAAWDGIGGALNTDAGMAFMIRIALVAVLTWVMFLSGLDLQENVLASLVLLGLFATWALAGHSSSLRWSLIGVPLDVAHHAAASAWIGGLAFVGIIAIRECDADELKQVVTSFGRLAATSVAVIVGTGVIQSFRLVGNPLQVFASTHGRLLVLKVAVLAAMLKVADINRHRVSRRFGSRSKTPHRAVENLRRAMGTELAVGLLVIAVTAALVVSPPAVAESATGSSPAPTTSNPLPLVTSIGSNGGCAVTGVTLAIGSTGSDVTCLQDALRSLGLLDASAAGVFDTATFGAVQSFQVANGLAPDGVVGEVTGRALGIWPAP